MIPVVLAIGDQIVEAYSRIGLVMNLVIEFSDLSSVLSVDSFFCPKSCITPILKLYKACLVKELMKSNESIG